jgi:DNA excision repair protein ERCC-4
MFNDIFSKNSLKSNKTIKRTKIIADIHEKDSMIFSELKIIPEIDLIIQSLSIGDFLIGNTIIERKTTSDFISSMLSKRLLIQLENMNQYEERFLIIEGNIEELYNNRSKLNPNAIRGFIISIITNHKVNVIFSKDYKDTKDYLIILAKRQLKNPSQSTLHSVKPKSLEEQKKYILESFPNTGPKKADELLKRFKSLSEIFNASVEELKGVLKNQAQDFKNILNS